MFNWAHITQSEVEEKQNAAASGFDEDPIEALLKSNTRILDNAATKFYKPQNLNFSKVVNANYGHEHQSVVSSICFHPSESLLMTSGLDRKVKLFQLADSLADLKSRAVNNVSTSKKANKVHSVFLPDLPVYNSRFIRGGTKAVLTGNRKHFYVFDLETNKLER